MRTIILALQSTRPKQWVKNLLVAVAPIAAGRIFSHYRDVILGVIAFTGASVVGYLINDWHDREFDKNHPDKKNRPFASKRLKEGSFLTLLFFCFILIIPICLYLPLDFSIAIIVYLSITISYTMYVKNQPVLEMIWLASGFLVRAVAGSTIIQQPPTGWFVVSVAFGALFIVSTKRYAELKKNHPAETRKVISQYNEDFLNLIITSSVSITLLTYSLWVFQTYPNSMWSHFTILPITLSILLYSWHTNNGDAEAPENLVYADKLMIFSGFFTVATLIAIIYT